MNVKGMVSILVLVLVIVGGWYVLTQTKPAPLPEEPVGKLPAAEEDLGSYDYACTDNVTMTMQPTADMQTIRVMIRGGAFPTEGILAMVPSDEGARYESSAMAFVGEGEEVALFSPTQTVTCEPVPSADSAPWNWGDAGGESHVH